ncbi:M48 family metallopeptidase [Fibrobacter succinogenes]|uniref:M48 family metallopeptidase n=1 Tax=Fibrobacter succinogenes TaxID=833 RepID=UPI001568A4EB|nr:SprT family zinc-dependent metalloprotease [Fibrobacter succinogenes]
MRMQVSGITVAVTKKDIKNIHLSVMPPDGAVRISAPLNLSDESIKIFVRTKVAWIKRQQEKFANQARLSEREYVSGESIFIFGRQYYLRVEHDRANGFVIDGQNVVLTVREASTAQQRENYVNEKLREMLVAEIEKRLPTWEKKTHLKCNGWQTKIMQNKWGSCNPAGKLWFNLHLAHTPIRCLDYVILHELLHLKVRHHNKDYIALLDKYMPFWQEVRKELNDFVLMPMK